MGSAYIPGQWPELRFADIAPTVKTLHLWAEVVGKVRLARTPWLNHSWHATLYVSARGLTTSLVPYAGGGIELEFDFTTHELALRATGGGERRLALKSGNVADFHRDVLDGLEFLGTPVAIDPQPNELADATPFAEDHVHRIYDPAAAHDLWRALVCIEGVFSRFRTRFLGKCSPVHLFWGSFDLAVTRFSGRRAPLHPGGIPHLPDAVTREAYSHEVSSAGFWFGDARVAEPSFYAYAYPPPDGFSAAPVCPQAARFSPDLGEFLLPYDAVRTDQDPDEVLLRFLQSTYEAAANLGDWNRVELECEEGRVGQPRRVG